VKKAQAFVGAGQDGMWGAKSAAAAKAKGYNSLAEVVAAMGGVNPEPEVDFASFGATDWEEYFSYIRQSEGMESAMAELNRMIQEGLVPQGMVAAATKGANGGNSGH
jgi:hypothetical protein